jgi:predicted component of type VI protein secretion system
MGRTIPTANMLIQQEIGAFLRSYGKGLSGKLEQRALYDILQLCKKHTQACGQAVRLVPFQAILMSLMLEQQKQLRKLIEEVAELSADAPGGPFV